MTREVSPLDRSLLAFESWAFLKLLLLPCRGCRFLCHDRASWYGGSFLSMAGPPSPAYGGRPFSCYATFPQRSRTLSIVVAPYLSPLWPFLPHHRSFLPHHQSFLPPHHDCSFLISITVCSCQVFLARRGFLFFTMAPSSQNKCFSGCCFLSCHVYSFLAVVVPSLLWWFLPYCGGSFLALVAPSLPWSLLPYCSCSCLIAIVLYLP